MDPITDIFKTMRVGAVVQARFEASAPWGFINQANEDGYAELQRRLKAQLSPMDLAHFFMISRGNCWLGVDGVAEPVALTGGDCFLITPGRSFTLRDAPGTPVRSFCSVAAVNGGNVIRHGGGGALTIIISGLLNIETPSIKPVSQLLPPLMLIRGDQAQTMALHTTLQMLASEMAQGAPGSELVANRLAEILFIQTLRAQFESGGGSCKPAWLRAIFDPQIGSALKAIHENVERDWTVQSLAEAAGMSRSAFAARFKELLGQTPLEYVTEWRMQKAIELLQSDRKLVEIAQAIGYESDAAFNKAFRRVLGMTPGELRREGANALKLAALN